jgi:hypothetical protein
MSFCGRDSRRLQVRLNRKRFRDGYRADGICVTAVHGDASEVLAPLAESPQSPSLSWNPLPRLQFPVLSGWMNNQSTRGAKRWTLVFVFLCIATLILVGFFLSSIQHSNGSVNQVREALRDLAAIECAVVEQDLDGDGIPNYWRSDITSLRQFAPRMNGFPRIVPEEVVKADVTALASSVTGSKATPFHGYFFRQIRFQGEKDLSDRRRFAICAFPAQHHDSTNYVYLLLHELGATFQAEGDPEKRQYLINISEYGKDLGDSAVLGLDQVPAGLDGHLEVDGWVKGGAERPPTPNHP